MADPFTPNFVDLVRNYTTSTGTGDFKLGPAANGFTSFTSALQVGDSFYYAVLGVDKPAEREIGRGTLQANGIVTRDPVNGTKTNFTVGTKTISLVAAAEWFTAIQQGAAVPAAPTIAADRNALAAAAAGALPAMLVEGGREGLFVWDAANRSSAVARDPRQGIHVAPASDPTGASGAWVRKFSGPIDVRWFGAKGDGAADDHPAMQAAIDYAENGQCVFVPPTALRYRCSSRLAIKSGIRLSGGAVLQSSLSSSHPEADLGSTIYFDANVAGLLIKYINDSDTPGGAPIYPGGHNTVIEGIRLLSANNGTASAGKYGIESRAVVTMRDVTVQGFGDHGVLIVAATGGSEGTAFGNANKSMLVNVSAKANGGDGFRIAGADANCITLISCLGIGNSGWDFYDNALINNTYIGCLSESGGLGSFKAARTDVPHAYIGCHTEGAIAELVQGCTVIGGSLGQSAVHSANSLAFIMSGGVATRYPPTHWALTYGGTTTGISLGSKEGNGAVLQWGHSGNFTDWKLMLNPPGREAGTWGFNFANAGTTTFMAWPDGWTRSGRSYAAEFPRGVCVGDQTNFSDAVSKLIVTGLAAPTDGTWQQGDIVINRAPSAGGTWAWVCTAAGSPGTWAALPLVNGGAISPASVAAPGAITSSGGGVGYATGAGGTVTQATNKSTGVTLNKICGEITMNGAALAANTAVTFTLTNSSIAVGDRIVLNHKSAGTFGAYLLDARAAAGSATVMVRNVTSGSLSEAIVIGFAVIKAVTA